MHRFIPLLLLLATSAPNASAMSFTGKVAHQSVSEGIRATVILKPLARPRVRDASADYRGTHHLMVAFTGAGGSNAPVEKVVCTVTAPDGSTERRDLLPMGDHAGENFTFRKSVPYEVAITAVASGKTRRGVEYRFRHVER